jgi:DNA-binding response OmpR family regulator
MTETPLTEAQLALKRQNALFAMYRRCRVLVIEDNAQARGVLRTMLRELGIERIDMAVSGQDGIEWMRKGQYNIVLCDYNLGKGKDGQQVLEEARHSKYLKFSTVFILVTAETSVEMVMGALEYQPDSYLAKPFTNKELRIRLDRAMQGKIEYKPIDDALQRKDLSGAIALCDERIASEKQVPMRVLRIKTECLLGLGDYAQAKKEYQAILAERDIAWAQLGLGRAELELGEYDAAEVLFRRLLKAQPNLVECYDWLARVQIAQSHSRAAQDTLEEATIRSPKAVLRQMALARLAFSNGSFMVAEKAYKRSIKLANDSCYRSPDNFLHYVDTLMVKVDATKSKVSRSAFDEAIVCLKRLRKEFSGSALIEFRGVMLEGRLLYEYGKIDEAVTTLQRAEVMFSQLNEKCQVNFADRLVTHMAMAGQIDACHAFVASLEQTLHEPGLVTHLRKCIADCEQCLVSNALNAEARALYDRGQVAEACLKFSEAARTPGASISVLFNGLKVCVELVERPDLNTQEWRKECEVFLSLLHKLDSGDHRYELYQSLQARLDKIAQQPSAASH